jgi:regulatory protein
VITQRGPKKLAYDKLREYGMASLARRAQSSGELGQKLRRRAEDPGDADRIVTEFSQAGYLNDQRYAEDYAAARLENEGLGKMRVLRDLRARRVAAPTAEKAVGGAYGEVDEAKLIEQYLARKFRNIDLNEHLSDPRKLNAAYRRLRMAGFSSSAVTAALKKRSQHAEELEDQAEDGLET